MRIEITTSTGAKLVFEPGVKLTDIATGNRDLLFNIYLPKLLESLRELEKEARAGK